MTPELIRPAFLNDLQMNEAVADDCQATLTAPLAFASAHLGRVITVPTGFTTDFASVPRLPFAYAAFGGRARAAAVVHDFLYRKSGILRADCDAVFLEAMEASGQSRLNRRVMWLGVRLFGWNFYQPQDEPTKGEA